MTYLVISKTLNQFQYYAETEINFRDDVVRYLKNQGKIILRNGDCYHYLSRPELLRGYRGVKVIYWGQPPEWFSYEVELLIKVSERE